MARRTFRRRGTGGRWFPVRDLFSGFLSLAIPGNGDTILDATGLIAEGLDDQIHNSGTLGGDVHSLADVVQGTGYFVKRIVGQYHASVAPVPDADIEWNCKVLLMMGIAVMDTDQDGVPNNLEKFQYASNDYGAVMQRWVFQRTWMLSGNGNRSYDGQYPANAGLTTTERLPWGTWEGGDVRSGPHIDCKTKALVRPDQRMFLITQARLISGMGETVEDRTLGIHGNLRMFATMRRNLRSS